MVVNTSTVAGGQRTITSTPFRELTDPTLGWTCVQQDSVGRTVAVGMFKGFSAAVELYKGYQADRCDFAR